jgi:hypothetical protein
VSRTSFLLRVDSKVLDALRRWADDELRSVNGQADYVLRQALRKAGRLKEKGEEGKSEGESEP